MILRKMFSLIQKPRLASSMSAQRLSGQQHFHLQDDQNEFFMVFGSGPGGCRGIQ